MTVDSIIVYLHIALGLWFLYLAAPLVLQGVSRLETVVRRCAQSRR